MAGALRESLIGPAPGASTLRPFWVQPEDLVGCVECDTMVDLQDVCGAVSEFMNVLSAGKYKQRRAVVRPKRMIESACWELGPVGPWGAAYGGWSWGDGTYELALSAPVQVIVAVTINGVALQPGQIALYDRQTLVRTDGAAWPVDQLLYLPTTEPGTFSVEYVWGQDIPLGGQIAALAWACYLANQLRRLLGEGECDLPDKVTAMVRQGTTLSRLTALDFIREGLTGVDPVDQWVAMDNPNHLRRQSTIASPDTITEVVS